MRGSALGGETRGAAWTCSTRQSCRCWGECPGDRALDGKETVRRGAEGATLWCESSPCAHPDDPV